MNGTIAKRSKAEVLGIVGFIFSLVAISLGVEFSIAGLIMCNFSLKEAPEFKLARTGKTISLIGIVFVSLFILVALMLMATR